MRLLPGFPVILALALIAGCGKAPELPQEIRRYSGEPGDKIVFMSGPRAGQEVVLPWRWLVKPISDEVAR